MNPPSYINTTHNSTHQSPCGIHNIRYDIEFIPFWSIFISPSPLHSELLTRAMHHKLRDLDTIAHHIYLFDPTIAVRTHTRIPWLLCCSRTKVILISEVDCIQCPKLVYVHRATDEIGTYSQRARGILVRGWIGQRGRGIVKGKRREIARHFTPASADGLRSEVFNLYIL